MNSPRLRIPGCFQVLASPGLAINSSPCCVSLRVCSEQQEDLLASILPLLTRGASSERLPPAAGSEASTQRWDKSWTSSRAAAYREVPSLSAADFELYTEQGRFFANFALVGNEPPKFLAAETAPPAAAQRKLAEARVLVAGLGRVGSRLVCSLAHAGVGAIWGVVPLSSATRICWIAATIRGRTAPSASSGSPKRLSG